MLRVQSTFLQTDALLKLEEASCSQRDHKVPSLFAVVESRQNNSLGVLVFSAILNPDQSELQLFEILMSVELRLNPRSQTVADGESL